MVALRRSARVMGRSFCSDLRKFCRLRTADRCAGRREAADRATSGGN